MSAVERYNTAIAVLEKYPIRENICDLAAKAHAVAGNVGRRCGGLKLLHTYHTGGDCKGVLGELNRYNAECKPVVEKVTAQYGMDEKGVVEVLTLLLLKIYKLYTESPKLTPERYTQFFKLPNNE